MVVVQQHRCGSLLKLDALQYLLSVIIMHRPSFRLLLLRFHREKVYLRTKRSSFFSSSSCSARYEIFRDCKILHLLILLRSETRHASKVRVLGSRPPAEL